jgi:hypothetical protein
MDLKYKDAIERLGCDLEEFSERENRNAYCWVFEGISSDKNFVPRAITTGRDECGSWGLSFFETLEQSKNRIKYICRKSKTLHLKLGTHIANGRLLKTDGISDNCNPEGHFNHHEYPGIDLSKQFRIIDISI